MKRRRQTPDLVDSLKCQLYNHFFELNQDLFKIDTVEYWRAARQFVESRIDSYVYHGKNPFAGLEKKVEEKKEEPEKSWIRKLLPF